MLKENYWNCQLVSSLHFYMSFDKISVRIWKKFSIICSFRLHENTEQFIFFFVAYFA